MRFSHVIVTKGRPEVLRTGLESSIATLPSDGEIIVVDGDAGRSAEPVVQSLDRGERTITYLTGTTGMCAQRNRGIDAAQGEIVVFTDDDCILRPGCFEALAAVYEDPSVVGATGRVLQSADPRIGSDVASPVRRLLLGFGAQGTMASSGFRRPVVDIDVPRAMQYMHGPLMSARRAVAAEVRFDEELERLSGYALGEDDDFSYRLSRRGQIRYVPSAVVEHLALGSGTMDRREFDRLVVANRFYLYRKNFAGTARGRLGFSLVLAVLFIHRLVNRDWRGARGLVSGVRDLLRPQAPAQQSRP